jgi:AcrR family transcriptional regulator
VSLDDIGRATGTSKSQLYHYFSGKNALVGAVIDRQRDRILAIQRPALEALATWEDITSWRDMIVVLQRELGCRGGCPLGSLANELAELDDTARVRLADAIGSWEQLVADGLATMAQRGELRSDADPATLALGVMASLQGGLHSPRQHAAPTRLKSPSTPPSPTYEPSPLLNPTRRAASEGNRTHGLALRGGRSPGATMCEWQIPATQSRS